MFKGSLFGKDAADTFNLLVSMLANLLLSDLPDNSLLCSVIKALTTQNKGKKIAGADNIFLEYFVDVVDEQMILGYTTESFAEDIKKAIQKIYKNSQTIAYKHYPEIFNDIYFNKLCTCVSTNDSEIAGAKKIGDMYMWYGINISGFAHRMSTRY